jgi:hypothetical protein
VIIKEEKKHRETDRTKEIKRRKKENIHTKKKKQFFVSYVQFQKSHDFWLLTEGEKGMEGGEGRIKWKKKRYGRAGHSGGGRNGLYCKSGSIPRESLPVETGIPVISCGINLFENQKLYITIYLREGEREEERAMKEGGESGEEMWAQNHGVATSSY